MLRACDNGSGGNDNDVAAPVMVTTKVRMMAMAW